MHRLQDIKTYFICPDHNEKYQKRRQHMESLLTRLGFTNWQHYKSGSVKYPQCLADANIDILQQNLNDEPVLILEDDVECSGHLEFEMPPGCDAIYFGLSRWAGSATEDYHDGTAQFSNFSDTQVRVLNMLSMHAVLHISRAFKEEFIRILQEHTQYNTDVLISRIQPKYCVLANRTPAFWQANAFNLPNNLESSTKIWIPGPTGTSIKFLSIKRV
jgi:hypothetical protein